LAAATRALIEIATEHQYVGIAARGRLYDGDLRGKYVVARNDLVDEVKVTNFRGAQQSRFNLVPDTNLTSNISSTGKREIETNRTSRGKPAPLDRVEYRVSGFSFGTAKWAK
jgi:hypothetical protein